jgi:hypothetical protein
MPFYLKLQRCWLQPHSFGYKSTRDVKVTGAIGVIFTKTYRHFATNDAIGFTFPPHPVKIGAITKKTKAFIY